MTYKVFKVCVISTLCTDACEYPMPASNFLETEFVH